MKGRDQTTPAKADTGHFENPADAEAAKQVAAGLAAGEDVFGDNDNDDGTPMNTAAPTPAPAAALAADDTTATGANDLDADDLTGQSATTATTLETQEAAAPAAAPARAPAPAPVPQFKTKSAAELAAAQKALLDKKADAFDKYSVGTMTAAEYSAVDSEVMLGLMGIASETALAQANTQTALQASEQALDDVKKLAKDQGLIDYYTDESAGVQFDNAVDMLAKDTKMAKLPDAEFFTKAHNLVLTMRGHTPSASNAPAPAPATTTGKPAPRADMTGPITLRTIPAAATPNTGGGVAEQLGRLNGLDFEEAVGAIPRSQRDNWLDS
jgi:hypothetical protein